MRVDAIQSISCLHLLLDMKLVFFLLVQAVYSSGNYICWAKEKQPTNFHCLLLFRQLHELTLRMNHNV